MFNNHFADASFSFWNDFLGLDLDPGEGFTAFVIAVSCLTGVIITLAYYVSSWASGVHRRRLEADLKREMLDRGMSADEIVKVIESSAPSEDVYARAVDAWGKRKK
jgi:hypothetical protein